MKNNKGVTLIVLVVTIVVLLILAGIIISASLGNRGIIEAAKNTVNALNEDVTSSKKQMDDFYKNLVERTTYE